MHGSLTVGATKGNPEINEEISSCSSLLFVSRAYHDYISQAQLVFATGTTSDGKNISFIISNTPEMISDPESANNNLLFVDGKCTPLPPVRMTQPYGTDNKWIIQDTEGMVDLTFEPVSNQLRKLDSFVMKIDMNIFFGKYEGVLKTSEGADISISGFAGIAREQTIRV